MRPFIMKSPAQFLPDGPTALTSEEWVAELNATRLFGDVNSTIRTPAQSEIGQFWAVHTGQQYSRAFVYLAANYRLDVMNSAGCWRCSGRATPMQASHVGMPSTRIASGDRSQRSVRVTVILNSMRIRIGLHLALRPITRNIRRLMGALRA